MSAIVQLNRRKWKSRKKFWVIKYHITASHRVSGGRLWLYGVIELSGSTVRWVAVVFVAAYRISAPTNRPANEKQKKNSFKWMLKGHL